MNTTLQIESRSFEPSLRLGARGLKYYTKGKGVKLQGVRKVVAYGKYAIKYIPLGKDLRLGTSLLQEVTLLRRLNHPHILELLDLGILASPPVLYEVFPLASTSLPSLLEKGAPLGERENLSYQIMSALAYLHERGIIHGSLSPAKILINRYDDGYEALLTGFENSEELSLNQSEIRRIQGTYQPPYLSPESLDSLRRESLGILSLGTDLWALGALLYELLAEDEPLFLQAALGATDHLGTLEYYLIYSEGIYTRLEEREKWLPLLPRPFQGIIEDLLSPRSEDRPRVADLIPEGWNSYIYDLSRPLRKGERLATRLSYPNNPHDPPTFLRLRGTLLKFFREGTLGTQALSEGLLIYEKYRGEGHGVPESIELDFLASLYLRNKFKNLPSDFGTILESLEITYQDLEKRSLLIAHDLSFDFLRTLPLDYLLEKPSKSLLKALFVLLLTPARFSFYAPEILEGALELSRKIKDPYRVYDSPVLRTYESEIEEALLWGP